MRQISRKYPSLVVGFLIVVPIYLKVLFAAQGHEVSREPGPSRCAVPPRILSGETLLSLLLVLVVCHREIVRASSVQSNECLRPHALSDAGRKPSE